MSTIIFLEGISKSGKTSWYERNLPLLREKYKYGVKYYHPHQSKEGQLLKQSWMENEGRKPSEHFSSKSLFSVQQHQELVNEYSAVKLSIAWQYLGLHLATQERIFHDVKKDGADLVVLDRTLLTVLAINFNRAFPSMGVESDIFPHPLHHLMIDYFRRFRTVFNDRKMLFFDCGARMDRYAVMFDQGMNHSYRKHLDKMPSGHTIFQQTTVFADKPISEVDGEIKRSLNL